MPDGCTSRCLAEITGSYDYDDGDVGLQLMPGNSERRVWWRVSPRELGILEDDFDVTGVGDLIGRECSAEYKNSCCVRKGLVFASQIVGVKPRIYETEADFAESE